MRTRLDSCVDDTKEAEAGEVKFAANACIPSSVGAQSQESRIILSNS